LGDGIKAEFVNGKSREDVLAFLSVCPKYPASACTKLIRKSFFDNEEMFFQKGTFCEDIDWTLKLILNSEIYAYCPVMHYNYRQAREGSITSTNTNAPKGMKDLTEILSKWSKKSDCLSGAEKEFVLSVLAYEYPILLYMYSKLSKKEKKAYKVKLQSSKYFLKARKTVKYKMIYALCSIFGIGITSYLIGFYMKIR